MDDLISRQDALAVCLKYNGRGYVWSCIMGDIRKLPSAQPEKRTENARKTHGVFLDVIDRQAAMDALARMAREKFNLSDEFNHYLAGLMDGENAIWQLPSAQPEIIRCRDCKHWKNKHLCESLSRYGSYETKADFYCGYAERKTND